MCQCHWQYISWRVKERDSALCEFFHVFRVEDHIHRTDRCIRVSGLDQFFVVGDAMCAPHVGHDIFITRIPVGCDLADHVFTQIFEVVEF